jgi:hypothetical protein
MATEEVLVAALKASPALAGVKVYPLVAADGAIAPYIVYCEPVENANNDLQGPVDLQNRWMQIDVYAKTKVQAVALKAAISIAVLAETSLGAVFKTGGSTYENDTKLFRQMQTFSLWVYE